MMYGCSVKPYKANNKVYTKQARNYAKQLSKSPYQLQLPDSLRTMTDAVGTIHFNLRKPNLVVLHHTAQQSCNQTISTFTNPTKEVSAHYVICKDGTIVPMLNDYFRAWHAGLGSWGNLTDINSVSIGIELDNDGFSPFPDEQIKSLISLSLLLKQQYNIPAQNFVAHSDIAPGRKVDPSLYFPWKTLAEQGIGFWYDTTNIQVPTNFNEDMALKAIGYSIKDLPSTFQSFRLRFMQKEGKEPLNTEEKKVLYAIWLNVKQY